MDSQKVSGNRNSSQGHSNAETVTNSPPIHITSAPSPQRTASPTDRAAHSRSTSDTKAEDEEIFYAASSKRNSQISVHSDSRARNSVISARSVPSTRLDREAGDDSKRRISTELHEVKRENGETIEALQNSRLEKQDAGLSKGVNSEFFNFSRPGSISLSGTKANSSVAQGKPGQKLEVITDNTDIHPKLMEEPTEPSSKQEEHQLAQNISEPPSEPPPGLLNKPSQEAVSSQNVETSIEQPPEPPNEPPPEPPNEPPPEPPSEQPPELPRERSSASPVADPLEPPDETLPNPSIGQSGVTNESSSTPPAGAHPDSSVSLPAEPGVERSLVAVKALSSEEEKLSERVRSFYAVGSDSYSEIHALSTKASRNGLRWQDVALSPSDASSALSLSRAGSATNIDEIDLQQNGDIQKKYAIQREDYELAGGLEDWQDVANGGVDRYGFIIPKIEVANGGQQTSSKRASQGLQRVSKSLQTASETPRRKKSTKRAASLHQKESDIPRSVSMQSLRRPMSSQSMNLSRHSTFRSKNRKLLDGAGDMLTLPRSSSLTVESGLTAGDDPRARRKEIEREEKWRRMARPVPSPELGGGMSFHFDIHNPKLIERTWKGIPDKWRATAWHAFLSASAKRQKNSLSDEKLIASYEEYQNQSSPDDVQIDIDVPRTISSHIMFRRRYRGGQRLLFRVLHAMSLHFVENGYVQGMAALAATLLAYYEEEKAFVMLVRLWELRGLEALYRSGFGGLMAALDDFEKQWLGAGEVAHKLTDLGIGPTAYGTRWYLTLFNYSIPFPAQLRVWDVFMLLGGDLDLTSRRDPESFGSTLDILHATSAALIDGMRDILLEADFEDAMKVLTSWVPIKDEDLFMRVAKAEWKMHKKKA